MTTRRNLLKAASFGSAALALPAARAATASAASPVAPSRDLPAGKLCVLVYGKSRRKLPDGDRSSMVALDLPSFEAKTLSSPVQNLHGLLRAGPDQQELWGIGHESAERMDIFDRDLNRKETRSYPGITFRGHGMPWGGGLLVSAERQMDPMAGGFLLHLDSAGKRIGQYPTGGLRPHDIVVCGDYFAIAHYGHRPGPLGNSAPMPGAASSFLFDVVSPGVSFLRQDTLELVAFHQLPGDAATTHLGATADGQVMAMGINTQRVQGDARLYDLAEKDGALLLPSEWYEHGYEIYAPMFRVDPKQGVVATLREPAARMRRGQSFSQDRSSGLVAATYAASQTLYLQAPGRPDRWLSTLDLGVPNPRGCAILAGSRFLAISGNEDNIAIVDWETGKLERVVGVPLGGHSHMFWIAA